MRYIKRLKIKSLFEVGIKMLFWLLASILLADRRTSRAQSRVRFGLYILVLIFVHYFNIISTHGFKIEICSVANGAPKKEIGRVKEFIVKQLEAELGQSMEMGTIHAGDFLRRFCSHWGMTNQTVKAAQEAVQKSEELDVRSITCLCIC